MWGQIRIMVQTCLRYARDEISLTDIHALLSKEEIRTLESGRTWHKMKASPFGLYLTNVEYPPDIFV